VAALGDSKPSSCGNSRARLKCGKPNKPPVNRLPETGGFIQLHFLVHPSSIPTPGMPDFEPILPGMVNWEKAAELRSLGIFG
jgi:hypothetical protein